MNLLEKEKILFLFLWIKWRKSESIPEIDKLNADIFMN